jgi:hypothetical protein
MAVCASRARTINDGAHVLELGDVEIDPDLHPLARRRLDALDTSPILRLGDSAHPGVRRR